MCTDTDTVQVYSESYITYVAECIVFIWHGAASETGINVDADVSHLHHCTKTCEAASCHAIRGAMYSSGSPASFLSSNRQHCHHRIAHLVPRDCLASIQSGSCARGSVTHALILVRLHRCTHTRRHQHTQNNLSSQLWVLFLMLIISISPNSCSGGACENAHPHSLLYPHTKTVSPEP